MTWAKGALNTTQQRIKMSLSQDSSAPSSQDYEDANPGLWQHSMRNTPDLDESGLGEGTGTFSEWDQEEERWAAESYEKRLASDKKACTNAAKPKPVQADTIFIHEASDFVDFITTIIEQLDGKGNLKILLECKVVAGQLCSKTFKATWDLFCGSKGTLNSVKTYEDMIEQANGKANANLKVVLEELEQQEPASTMAPSVIPAQRGSGSRGDDDENDISGNQTKHRKKTHEPSAEEEEIMCFVETLQRMYHCSDKSCGGPTCLVQPNGTHVKLVPAALKDWASAMASHQDGVDDKTPPNHPTFFKQAGEDTNDISLLAAHRRNLTSQSQAPNININLSGLEALIHPNHPSQMLDLDGFQKLYLLQLTNALVEKLRENEVSGPDCLLFVTEEEYDKIGLTVGQKDLRCALSAWKASKAT
ncbi:hypothetical protein K435DRAFT_800051 [Dendrothele bispora CBS 962.96]|uniref:Uncharacterized protein n=1 Tax=Dendrothele bispora (strain CBS 962.96) TaxID=1314807 RepID=A0A4S8LV73_DENBC|nr:hypothetical protein K435DRAFT_800051 [Dendrothele bispora CBS 962.96]